MPTTEHGRGARRQRNTVLLSADAFQRLWQEAVDLAVSRKSAAPQSTPQSTPQSAPQSALRPDAGRTARGEPGAGNAADSRPEVGKDGGLLVDRVTDDLLALLKAFVAPGMPKGWLTLAEDGRPVHMQAILDKSNALAAEGNSRPKLLSKVRAGKPVDLRMALAALQFFRWVLQRPALSLDALGAVEPQREQAARAIAAALQLVRRDLPTSVFESFEARAHEAASHAVLIHGACYTYSHFRIEQDVHGVWRLHLRRQMRYESVRLVPFPGFMRPFQALEWHEARSLCDARLCLRLLAHDGSVLQEVRPPLHKQLSFERGLVVGMSDDTVAALRPLLHTPPSTAAGPRREVTWDLDLVFNLADRDIIVSYVPHDALRIHFDRAAHPDFAVTVGDAPGLVATAEGWRLDRALAAREVLAVRLRYKALQDADAWQLSPSGEWRGALPGNVRSPGAAG